MSQTAESLPPGRVRWLCRRGMKELDVLFERFLAEDYPALDADTQGHFLRFAAFEDPDVNAMLLGRQPAPDAGIADIIERMARRRA